MRKVAVLSIVLLFIMGASLANAAPNVASLTNRGSVLFFAKIDTTAVNPAAPNVFRETFIKIGNDANKPVDVKCYWVRVGGEIITNPLPHNDCAPLIGRMPPQQTPVDFAFTLTRNQPVMFAAGTGASDPGDPIAVAIQPFGVGNIGYLVCWAVNEMDQQINWNYLNGEAIVTSPAVAPTILPTAYEYPAWTLGARSNTEGKVVGTPGLIEFNGTKYDSMPMYLTYVFPAAGSNQNLFRDLELTLVQGSQNFNTMAFEHRVTRANFALWNENESPFSNISMCTWCWRDTLLFGPPSGIVNNQNFGLNALGSSVGRFRLQGRASQTCIPALTEHQQQFCIPEGQVFSTYNTGLLGFAVQLYNNGNYTTVNTPGAAGQFLLDKITYTPFGN